MGRLALIALAGLLCAGCSGALTNFEHPIVAESGREFDRALVGRWVPESPQGELASPDEMSIDISVDGDGGIAVIHQKEPDKDPTLEEYRLVTARFGDLNIVSAQPLDDADHAWIYFRYTFVAPDAFVLANDDSKFWADAVRNKMISGKAEKGGIGSAVTVTASEAELRAFVRGYGAVIFAEVDDGEGRLRRIAPGS